MRSTSPSARPTARSIRWLDARRNLSARCMYCCAGARIIPSSSARPESARPRSRKDSRSSDKDKALARRFQRIDVVEPTQDEAVQILSGIKSYYEKHHNVRYTSAAIKSAVELSARYVNDRFLPDKAIDVMDEAGVAGRLRGAGARGPTTGGARR